MLNILCLLAAFILGIIVGWEAKKTRNRMLHDKNQRYGWQPTNKRI